MFYHTLIISTLIFFNSCSESKKTVNNTENEIHKTEVYQNGSQILIEPKIIESNKTFSHSAWNVLLQKHVTTQGNVSYKGFKEDLKKINVYLNSLSEKIPQESWAKAEKLAYWINAYNAFTIKLIIDNYPVKSIKDIKNRWDIGFIKLGNKTFTLNDIEHKILRKMGDPRIHFGIVCASVSCPKLQNTAFEASTIEVQLDTATKEFLADSSRNILSEKSIKISKIFKWFSSDFKHDGSLIDFLNKYSEITISPNANKSYVAYDWTLNE
ncbi:MAG: DUF547 domain-containing protein [Bacteroidetes bacterium]|nr:MAG: DUF547 domain-containing protein [Bacteroidota bacterium]